MFTFCQQLRFNYKILKRVVLEHSTIFLKFWDTTSVDLDSLTECGSTCFDDADREAPQEMNIQSTISTFARRTINGTDYIAEEAKKYEALTPFLRESFPELH